MLNVKKGRVATAQIKVWLSSLARHIAQPGNVEESEKHMHWLKIHLSQLCQPALMSKNHYMDDHINNSNTTSNNNILGT